MTQYGEIIIIAAFLTILTIYTLDFLMRWNERAERKRFIEAADASEEFMAAYNDYKISRGTSQNDADTISEKPENTDHRCERHCER